MKNLGERIKVMREEMGITQGVLAEYLNVDQSTISNIEKGKRNISSTTLDKLSALFCMPVSDFLDESSLDFGVAFRGNGLSSEDLKKIAQVNKIVQNQFFLDEIMEDEEDDR